MKFKPQKLQDVNSIMALESICGDQAQVLVEQFVWSPWVNKEEGWPLFWYAPLMKELENKEEKRFSEWG